MHWGQWASWRCPTLPLVQTDTGIRLLLSTGLAWAQPYETRSHRCTRPRRTPVRAHAQKAHAAASWLTAGHARLPAVMPSFVKTACARRFPVYLGHERLERVVMDPGSPAAHQKHVDQTAMDAIRREMAAYDEMRAQLEAEHLGKWVIVRSRELVGVSTRPLKTQPMPRSRGLAVGLITFERWGTSASSSCRPQWPSACSNAVRRVCCVRVSGGTVAARSEISGLDQKLGVCGRI